MPTRTDPQTLARLQELGEKATERPWAWRWPSGSTDGPEIVHPRHGLLIVMDAVRKGMRGATVRFARRSDNMGGLMCDAEEFMPKRLKVRPDYQEPDNPDMALIVAAVNALPDLIADAAALAEAEKYGAPVAGAKAASHRHAKCSHNEYWTTGSGACMACRAVDADARAVAAEAEVGRLREVVQRASNAIEAVFPKAPAIWGDLRLELKAALGDQHAK